MSATSNKTKSARRLCSSMPMMFISRLPLGPLGRSLPLGSLPLGSLPLGSLPRVAARCKRSERPRLQSNSSVSVGSPRRMYANALCSPSSTSASRNLGFSIKNTTSGMLGSMYASAVLSVSFLFLVAIPKQVEASRGGIYSRADAKVVVFKVGDMISVDKQRRLDRWRRGDGVCYVCGHCLKSPFSGDTTLDSRDDGPALSEMCPIRLCMLRFNALADHQEAHVLDNYTFLEGRRSSTTTFNAELEKYYESHIRKLNPGAFEAFKLQYPAIFGDAVAIMQRTVSSCTVPTCTVCNKAMVSDVVAAARCSSCRAM